MLLIDKTNMAKLIVMQGLPASGKSTKAKELMESMGNTVRINKDLLREMLHFNKFTGINEGNTKDASKELALYFLAMGTNVIIDDTNLNPRVLDSWKSLAKDTDSKFELIRMDTTWEECVMRDSTREKAVGNTVIKNMALQYETLIVQEDSIVICDIDGTIANIKHRLKYAKGPEKNWDKFFSLLGEDTVIEDTRKMLVRFYNQGYTIIFVSARPEEYKEQTLAWLDKNFLSFAWTLIMRRTGDKRDDTQVKQQILDTYFPYKGVIHCVIDDRPSVIRMWRSNGLEVIDVGEGIEF